MIQLQWPVTFSKKRQTAGALGAPSEWIPTNNSFNFPQTESTRLATVGRCLRLYSDFANLCPLKVKGGGEHYLLDLLDRPASFMTRQNFFEILTMELLLNGGFVCRVLYNERGQVTKLLPYRSGEVFCYPVNGESSDGLSIEQGGFYYRDFKGRTLTPDQIFHIKDCMFNNSDRLNGLSRVYLYWLAFQQGYSILSFQKLLSDSGLRGPSILTGLDDSDSESLKGVRDSAEQFTRMGQNSVGRILSLPSGFELKNMMSDHPSKIMEYLSSFSDLTISRVFSVPVELLNRSDAKAGGTGAQHLKEATRFFVKGALKNFLKNISDSLSALAMDKTKFYFKTDALKASDLREQSMFLKGLVDSGVLSTSDALNWLGKEDD